MIHKNITFKIEHQSCFWQKEGRCACSCSIGQLGSVRLLSTRPDKSANVHTYRFDHKQVRTYLSILDFNFEFKFYAERGRNNQRHHLIGGSEGRW